MGRPPCSGTAAHQLHSGRNAAGGQRASSEDTMVDFSNDYDKTKARLATAEGEIAAIKAMLGSIPDAAAFAQRVNTAVGQIESAQASLDRIEAAARVLGA